MAEAEGGRRLLVAAYGDHGLPMVAMPYYMVLLPHSAQLRQAARHIIWKGIEAGAQGDRLTEHRLRTDVLRFGGRLRRDGDTLIARLVGAHIQFAALRSTIDKPWITATTNGKSNGEAAHHLRDQEYLRRLQREAPQLSGEVDAELPLLYRFQETHREEFPSDEWNRLLGAAKVREVAGLVLASNLMGLLLLWGAAAALCAGLRLGSRQADAVGDRQPSAIASVGLGFSSA